MEGRNPMSHLASAATVTGIRLQAADAAYIKAKEQAQQAYAAFNAARNKYERLAAAEQTALEELIAAEDADNAAWAAA
jgi:ribosome-associated translation inhibitor RaiA